MQRSITNTRSRVATLPRASGPQMPRMFRRGASGDRRGFDVGTGGTSSVVEDGVASDGVSGFGSAAGLAVDRLALNASNARVVLVKYGAIEAIDIGPGAVIGRIGSTRSGVCSSVFGRVAGR
jgi:hypothetical protein